MSVGPVFKFLLLFFFIVTTHFATAQYIADGVPYQLVVRDVSGNELANQLVNIKIGIYSGSATGTLQWEETTKTKSDQSGLVKLVIGKGSKTGNGMLTAFSDINWSGGAFYVKVSIDVTGGINYMATGSAQLLSVPYALHALGSDKSGGKSLTQLGDVKITNPAAGNVLEWDDSNWIAAIDNDSDTVLFAWNANYSLNSDTTSYSLSTNVSFAKLADTTTASNSAGLAVLTKNTGHADTAQYALYSIPTDWEINGNSIDAAAKSLGTLDAKDLVFKTNNTERLRLIFTGNMQIGNSSNLYNLSIDGNDGMLGIGTFASGAIPVSGAGTKLMWYPQKASFRAGAVSANQWDDANVGNYSFAAGYNCIAGLSSFATGNSSIATGGQAIAMGNMCQATGAGESYALGDNSIATTPRSVALGWGNVASTGNAAIAIGSHVTSTAIGNGFGTHSTVSAGYSTAFGYYGSTNAKTGSFVYADASSTAVTNATANNQFLVRASGGTNFFSDPGSTMGVTLPAGGGSWASVSDKNKKENFEQLNGEDVLKKIRRLKITSWNYISQADGIKHIGPTAQDFYKAFHLGESRESISMIDMDGITLLGIKSLYQQLLDMSALGNVKELTKKLDELDNFDELNSRLEALQNKLSK